MTARPSIAGDRPAAHQRPDARQRADRRARPTRGWSIVGDAVVEVGTGRPPTADTAIDADGRCVMPGFVDSHSHLVFAGDRSAEFAARMAGRPYSAGGIGTHGRGDPAGERRRAAAAVERALLAEAHRVRDDDDRDQVRLRLGDRRRGSPAARRRRADRRDDVPRRPRRARRVRRAGRRLRRPRVRRDARRAARRTPAGSTRSARPVRSRPTSAAPCSRPGRGPASACACTPTSSALATGVRLGVELGCASVDHCTYLSDDDVDALAGSSTVATFLPATDFSTRQPYPDARRVLDAGVTVALAANCNPGSSYTTSMPFCIALAVRDLGHDPRRGDPGGDGRRCRRAAARPTSASWRRARAPISSSSTPRRRSTSCTGRECRSCR